jgi:tetratricopeptide (TPR) repeat protein
VIGPWSAAVALLASASVAPGPDCAAVEPAPTADRATAREYLEVGDSEWSQGRAETAKIAYRHALALDPSNVAARTKLLELCRAPGEAGDGALELAARAVGEGRSAEAVALLEPRYKLRPDPFTALLYGIALYERGEDDAAVAALEHAREDARTRDSALVFLGLLALRDGDSGRAAALFDRANQESQGELARTARDLSILARRDGRLMLSAEAEGGYDSNVDQAPDHTPVAGLSGDLLYGGVASAVLQPLGERGPYAVAGARLRNLLEIGEYDLGWAGGAAGYRFGRGRDELRVEYAYDAIWLGFQPFSTAHQVQVDGALELPFARLGALASARAESYLMPETEKYSGPTFDGAVSAGWALGPVDLRVQYRGQLHRSQDETVGWLDHGPGVRTLVVFPSGRVVVDAEVTVRTYGAPDPGFGNVVRQDAYLDGVISVEEDVGRQLAVYLSAGGRKAFSNVETLEYTRLFGSAGVIFTAGLW